MTNAKKFVPVMLTPFKENGTIDYEGLTTLTEFYLRAGAKGLFANCLSSEMYELTPDERLGIVKHIIDTVKGAVPVVATGTFKGSPEEQAGFIKDLYNIGVEAAIIITGIMATEEEPDEVLNERIFRLMELTPGIPVGFYECPVPYKRVLKAGQLGLIVEKGQGRVIYHKDTSLDLAGIKDKLAAVKNENFGLYDAYMAHAVASLKAGAAGLSCIQGNYFPELIVWLCENFDQPAKEKEVNKVQQFLIDNMDIMHTEYPTVAKYFLRKRGLPITLVSRTREGMISDPVKAGIDRLFEKYELLRGELGIK